MGLEHIGCESHTAEVSLGGKRRTVRLSWQAIREFERVYGGTINAYMSGGLGIDGIYKLLSAALRHGCGLKVSEAQLDRWLSAEPGKLGEIVETLNRLVAEFLTEAMRGSSSEEDEPSDPLETASTGTG